MKGSRPERWIVTISSSDQWLATIGNQWKTIATNGFWTQKPLENHCYQWFWWPKTIEKPLLAMFFGPKSIGKPLLPMVLETKNHRKTIDINGDLQSIEWSFFVTLGQVSLSKDCLPLGICWTNHASFCFFGFFCEPALTFPKTIEKPLTPMVHM